MFKIDNVDRNMHKTNENDRIINMFMQLPRMNNTSSVVVVIHYW